MSVVAVVCCQVEVSATDSSPVQKSPAECGASECNSGTSKRRRTPSRDCRAMRKKIKSALSFIRAFVMNATA